MSYFSGIRTSFSVLAGTLLVAVGLAACADPAPAREGIVIPAPVVDEKPDARMTETAVFAGGCFWGVQGVFQHVDGVTNAVSGYAGGKKSTANYGAVGYGRTGHAEAVRVTFDPQKVSYGHLLHIYFSVTHDPTQLDRQNGDIGKQYRSAIFPTSPEQADIARAYIAQLDKAKVYGAKIVTTIEPGKAFYPAEDYHQDYLNDNPTSPYIAYNDMPKIENLRRLFPKDYRQNPVLVSRMGTGS